MARFVNPIRYLKCSLVKELLGTAKVIASFPQLFTNRQHLVFQKWNEKFGDRHRIRVGGQNFIFLSDPTAIQRCFDLGEDYLDAGTARQRLLSFMPKHSLLLATGERHQVLRKIVGQSVRAASKSSIDFSTLDCFLTSNESIESKSLSVAIEQTFRRAVCRFLVGQDNEHFNQVLSNSLTVIDNISTAALILPTLKNVHPFRDGFAKVEAAIADLNRILEQFMQHGPGKGSLMGQLLRHANAGTISELEVRDNVAFFSLVMLRSLNMLYGNVAQALGVELDWQDVLRTGINQEKSSAKLIRATIKETLRITPMVPLIARRAKKSFDIDKLNINANDIVIITPFLTHFRPDSFVNPDQFDPRRFLGQRKYAHQFLPFGGGNHHCIGSGWTIDAISQLFMRLLPCCEFASEGRHPSLHDFSMRAMLLKRPSNFTVRRVEDVARHKT